jgi:hypothetical protein
MSRHSLESRRSTTFTLPVRQVSWKSAYRCEDGVSDVSKNNSAATYSKFTF